MGWVSAASTTARWSSRVGSAKHPEFIGRHPGITPEPTGPLSDRRSPIGRPRGIRSITNFNLPKYPRRPNYWRNSPSEGSARSGPLPSRIQAVPRAESTRILPGRLHDFGCNETSQFPFAVRQTNDRKDKDELGHSTIGIFILQWGGEGST